MSRKALWIGISLVALVVAGALVWQSGTHGRETGTESKAKESKAPVPEPRSTQVASAESRAAIPVPVASRPAVETANRTVAEAPASPDANNPNAGRIRLFVTDEDSKKPIEGARAGLWQHNKSGSWTIGDEQLTARTDANGVATLEVPASQKLKLQVVRPNDETGPEADIDLESIDPGEALELRVALPTPKAMVFWGKLVSAETGTPISDATITIYDSGEIEVDGRSIPDAPIGTTVSDADGMFRASAPSHEDHWFRVDKPQFGTLVFAIAPGFESPEKAREIRLPRGAALRVLVTSAAGEPLSNAHAWAWAESEQLEGGRKEGVLMTIEWKASADERGVCTFDGLPADVPLSVEVRSRLRTKRAKDAIALAAGETREWKCVIGGDGALRGRVVDQDEQPVAKRGILLVPRKAPRPLESLIFGDDAESESVARAITDSEGNFLFEDVTPGDYWVGPAPKNLRNPSARAICPSAIRVAMPAGRGVDVTIRVWRGLFIEGRVVDPAGAGVKGTPIWARDSIGSRPIDGRSEDGGAFKLGPLIPGRYRLSAVLMIGKYKYSSPVEANAGDTDVTIRLSSTGARLSGRLLDGETHQSIEGRVRLLSGEFSIWRALGGGAGTGTSNGEFVYDEMPPGTYTLVATTPDGKVGIVKGLSLESGQNRTGLEVPVAPGARARVRTNANDKLMGFQAFLDGFPVGIAFIAPGEELAPEIILPPGNLEFRFYGEGGVKQALDVTLLAGETKEISTKGN